MDANFFLAVASSAFGALAGSLSAFWLGRSQQMRDRLDKEYGALLSAQYALMSQWTVLEDIRKDLLEDYRSRPDRHLHMPIYKKFGSAQRIDFHGISFICCSDNPDLLQQIHLAEQNFDTAFGSLEIRNDYCDNLISEGDIKVFDSKTGQFVVSGELSANVFMLKQATDNLYQCVDGALPKLALEVDDLRAFVKKEFKGRKALAMGPKE